MPAKNPIPIDRRTYLAAMAGVGTSSIAGCWAFDTGDDRSTTGLAGEDARELAERFAPTLYFDEHEKWFPTDPRRYERERDGEPVVDGFEALDGYHERYADLGSPPDPTVFYHALEYDDSPLAVVQFWQYSTFDQFSVNFHWHDWEVLHVFVDTDTQEPQLYVASSHSRSVPNNEFLDPDPERIPAILVELGSHSNTLSLNDQRERFRRLPFEDVFADITNGTIDRIDDLAELPIAYGLPRDEGAPLPFAVPQLDGSPIHEHDRLPAVDATDLIDASLVVGSFDAISSPPTDLPRRTTGLVLDHVARDSAEADVAYELVPASELEHITDFPGPQLSFEFAIPDVLEDAISGHITTVGIPWESPRYHNPAADISDPNHRATLAERYDAIGEPAPVGRIVAFVTEAVTTDDAPEDEGLATEAATVESVALLESDPELVPTFAGGVTILQDIPTGEHRLTLNGAGVAPHSEVVAVGSTDGTTVAGVAGEIPLVANEHATKLEVDPREADSDLTELAVEDDFAGRIYDSPLSGPDALYVHRGGAYTTEVRDSDDEIGAFRVNPADEERVRIDDPRTGKAPLAAYLADIAAETRASVASVGDDESRDREESAGGDDRESGRNGLVEALGAVAEAAGRAAESARAGNRSNANRDLETVSTRLDRVASRLTEARGSLPEPLANAIDRRLEQARRRSDQAQAAEKL